MSARVLIPSALAALALLTAPAAARAPEQTPRPMARGGDDLAPPAQARPRLRPPFEANRDKVGGEVEGDARPRARPPSPQLASAALPASIALPQSSPRPAVRPDDIAEKAFFKRRKKRRGSVCGDIEIQGEAVGNVPGRIRGCGVKDAVAITSVAGVALSRPATMDCGTAQALNRWVEESVKPTFRRRGPVVELRVAAHYVCRTRNSQKGTRISEHGKGRAIDISAFVMQDGEVLTVLEGWKRGSSRRLLQRVHKEACGPFGTVLGPDADRWHQDHFHLDTARYRSGPYCR